MRATFELDMSNLEHLKALATLAQAGITVTLGESASVASSDKPAKTSKAHTYAEVHDVDCMYHVNANGGVTYTYADDKNSYVGESGIRKCVNAKLRALGGVWDKDARVWTLPTENRPADGAIVTVMAAEWQAARDKAAERAAKRATRQ